MDDIRRHNYFRDSKSVEAWGRNNSAFLDHRFDSIIPVSCRVRRWSYRGYGFHGGARKNIKRVNWTRSFGCY